MEACHLLSAGVHDRHHHHQQYHLHQNHHCQYKHSHCCCHHHIIIIKITSISTSDQLVWSLFHSNQVLTPVVSIFQLLLLGLCLLHLSRASRCSGQNFDLADLTFVKIGFRLDRICQRIIKTLPKAQQTQGWSALNKVIAFKSYRNYQNSASKS